MGRLQIDRADVIVVGGGPAGLMAAWTAASCGVRVALIEQMPEPGLKLLASGGGRCNLTNTLGSEAFMTRFGRQGRFMAPALKALDATRLRQWFHKHGVKTHSPDGFCVYPQSEKAYAVRNALWHACREAGVVAMTRTRVKALVLHGSRCGGVGVDRGEVRAPAVILATGGLGYPHLGASGDGFRLAEKTGHRIVPPCPALVPLVTRERWPARLAGVSLPLVRVRLEAGRVGEAAVEGPVLFTHRGLSGPAILDLSGRVAETLRRSGETVLRLSFPPYRAPDEWRGILDMWTFTHGRRVARNALASLMPRALAELLCEWAGVPDGTPSARLTAMQREQLAALLAGVRVAVVDTEGFERAMITRGGVSLQDVDPNTLSSRRVSGLFFAGEILDLDGPTGGFNLQWAFSSGSLAGRHAAQASAMPRSRRRNS